MGRFAAWLWRRHRRHYSVALGVVVELMLAIGFLPMVLAGLWALLGLTARDCVLLAAVGAATMALGPAVAIGTAGQRRAALDAWGRGDASDPVAAWAAAVHAPPEWTERASTVNLLAVGGVLFPILATRADLTGVEAGALALMAIVLFVGGGLVIGTGFQMLLRPMLDEVTTILRSTSIVSAPARWGLRGRFHVAIASACFLTGVLTAAAVSRTDTRESAVVTALVAASVVTGYLLLLFGGLLVLPSFRPLADLIAATTRVRRGAFDDPVPVTTADDLGQLGAAFNDMQRGLREREALQAAFGSYVDPTLAARLIESGSSVFEGEELEVTVLFADVRSFTTYSEGVSPAEAVALLNRLFDVMVPVIDGCGGHTNHYLGDGLLAVFGAPNPLALH
ncbi:MAG TPA: adenylate/guanylate cyclase domain-containing protein, partial [Acidimicrobiales bacterium]|nr:adenylate/guanylate cyclase domain-containing protein [Acidimicrobiales bacterium]